MTGEQRKRLFSICRDSWFMADTKPSEVVVEVHLRGTTVTFDHCLKHGTGTGRLLSIGNPGLVLEVPQSIDEIDQLLLELAKDYRLATVDLLDELSKSIRDIETGDGSTDSKDD